MAEKTGIARRAASASGLQQPLLQVQNLGKQYSKLFGKVLDGVSFKAYPGQVVAIVGPSGAGKTTLLNILGGLDFDFEGTVKVAGKSLKEYNPVFYRRYVVGTIFQQFFLIDNLNVFENAALPLKLAGEPKKYVQSRIKFILQKVGMLEHATKMPNQLSGGQAQRVAVARALANSPKLILADEPTGNLDTKTGKAVIDLIVALTKEQNATALIVTHDLEVIKTVKNRIYLRDGRIVKIEMPQNERKTW